MTVDTEVFVSIVLTIAQGFYASDNIRLNLDSSKSNVVWYNFDVHLFTNIFEMSEAAQILKGSDNQFSWYHISFFLWKAY